MVQPCSRNKIYFSVVPSCCCSCWRHFTGWRNYHLNRRLKHNAGYKVVFGSSNELLHANLSVNLKITCDVSETIVREKIRIYFSWSGKRLSVTFINKTVNIYVEIIGIDDSTENTTLSLTVLLQQWKPPANATLLALKKRIRWSRIAKVNGHDQWPRQNDIAERWLHESVA